MYVTQNSSSTEKIIYQFDKEVKNTQSSIFKKDILDLYINSYYKCFPQASLNKITVDALKSVFKFFLIQSKIIEKSNETFTESDFENKIKIESLKNMYFIPDELEVYQYLYKNLSLYEYLEQANINIKKIFGDSTNLLLKVDTDPEVPDYKKILIIIQTNLYPDEVYIKIKQLNSKWFLNLPFDILKRLSINVEFE